MNKTPLSNVSLLGYLPLIMCSLLLLPAQQVIAGLTVIELDVDSKTVGGFGPLLGGAGLEPDPTVQELVEAVSLSAGQVVEVIAVGEILLDTDFGFAASPDGIFAVAPRFNPFIYFPLEEAAVDAGDLAIPVPADFVGFPVGALMGAFVPQGVVNDPGFIALNDDPDPDLVNFGGVLPNPVVVGSIPSDALFLIGSGPFMFEAPEDGTLFLGVNDAFTPNNSGEFSVSITIDNVLIDIKPGSDPNSINLKSKGNIPVAILTTDTFDATQVDWETVSFGPDRASESHGRSHVNDVDNDGDMDVVLHFKTQEAGIACGDIEATLTGQTFGGEAISGTDSIKIVRCP